MNDQGTIVGRSETSDGFIRAFLYRQGREIDLGFGRLQPGQGHAVPAKLNAAAHALRQHQPHSASHLLHAFTTQVQALIKTRRLSDADGRQVIDAANAVIVQLNRS